MTDPNNPAEIERSVLEERATQDPDRHSTWNTLDSSVDIDEVLDEDDLENFLIEPMPNPLDPAPLGDDPGVAR